MGKRKVIIAGGGLAGLSAAYDLCREARFDVHILEKNRYLGGRVQSCTVNGQGIDVGGFLIYPWYERYHHLIRELGLSEELIKVPPVGDYYAGQENAHDKYEEGLKLSFKDIMEIFIRVFPNPLTDSDPTEPELHAYGNLTIQEYLRSLNLEPEKTEYYLRVFDTYLQGYCYGPVAEHKMAFMASTLFQNIFHGDVHAASYLRNGSQVFIDALSKELESKGVSIHLNCAFQSVNNNQLITSRGEMTADDFLFCHIPSAVRCSSFMTATVSFSGIAQIHGDADWGSSFYKEDSRQPFSVLSIVNLGKLYTEKASGYLNLNIKVNRPEQQAIASGDLMDIIRTELQIHFKDITVLELVNRIDWGKAMPIAQEDYIESVKAQQGLNNVYYAGDFMGCPSMETALMSGKRAAQQLIAASS